MKITAKAKRKLAAAKKKAGKFLRDKDNRKYIIMAVAVVLLYVLYSKFGKRKVTTVPKPATGGKVDLGGGAIIDTNPINVIPSNVVPHIAQTGHHDHINMSMTGGQEGWILNDNSTATKDDDEVWRYVNGGEVLDLEVPLSNYRYESNIPFTIIKYKVKRGTGDTAGDDSKIGTFDKNSSLAIYNVTFETT